MENELWLNLCGLLVNIALVGVAIMAPSLPTLKNRVYKGLLVISLVGNALGCVQQVAFPAGRAIYGLSFYLSGALSFVQIIGLESVMMLYIMYINALFGVETFNRVRWVMVSFGNIFTMMMLVVALFVPGMLEFTEYARIYFVYPGGVILVTQFFWYAPYGFLSFMKRRKLLTQERQVSFVFFFILICAGVPVRMITKSTPIVQFMQTVTLLFIEFTLQNPSEDTDTDTGFWNRRSYITMINRSIAQKEEIDLIGMNLDGLSILRSRLGNGDMDDILSQFKEFFTSVAHGSQIYRVQNDMLVLAMPSNFRREEIVRQLIGRFRNPWKIGEGYKTFYTHMCILSCPQEAESADETIQLINLMLSEAAAQEKGIMHLREMDIPNRKRINELDALVRKALDEKLFEVYYQPIYTPSSENYLSAEALLRLHHPEEGFVSPKEFVPIAERNGTILQIDQFVLEEVCKLLEETEAVAFGIKNIEVNLSVVECLQSNLTEQVEATLAAHGIAHEQINLEITESAETVSTMIMENIMKIAQKGFILSMDDFGTGYSNIMRIVDMPVSIVKLDKSLISPALRSKRAYDSLVDIIRMNHEMGFETITEGIETAAEAEMVAKIGTDHVQGFYYAKPMPRDEFIEFLRAHRTRSI